MLNLDGKLLTTEVSSNENNLKRIISEDNINLAASIAHENRFDNKT